MDALILKNHPERAAFLGQPSSWQKENLLSLFGCPTSLQSRCINPDHADAEASMVVYPNGAYCFGCKKHWWPDQFVLLLGDDELEFERVYKHREDATPRLSVAQVETFHRWLVEGPYTDRLEWLLARGIRLDAVLANLIGHTGEAFAIPVIDEQKLLQAIRYRRDDLCAIERPKYWGTAGRNKPMLYRPEVINPAYDADTVFLCEGELDAIRLSQEGYPAVSMTNGAGAAAKAAELLKAYKYQFLVLDQDDAGRDAARSLLQKLETARVVTWSRQRGKDVTEFLLSSPLSAFKARVALANHQLD
jgi:5S rRNA maturation endonuclease (ribonuclease M5)